MSSPCAVPLHAATVPHHRGAPGVSTGILQVGGRPLLSRDAREIGRAVTGFVGWEVPGPLAGGERSASPIRLPENPLRSMNVAMRKTRIKSATPTAPFISSDPFTQRQAARAMAMTASPRLSAQRHRADRPDVETQAALPDTMQASAAPSPSVPSVVRS